MDPIDVAFAFSLEYGSLHDLLRNETMYLSGEIILQIMRDVAQGLRYLHTAKVSKSSQCIEVG